MTTTWSIDSRMNTASIIKKNRPVIIVMAKLPQPGQVKTRLRPILNDSECAALAVCFLRDSVSLATQVCEDVIVAFTPACAKDAMVNLLPQTVGFIAQQGRDLGERLENVIKFAEEQEYSPIIVIGTDSPSLPSTYLSKAIVDLVTTVYDLALGPTLDGGFYLIGMQKLLPGLFQNIKWSTESVYEQTLRNANTIKQVITHRLPAWYDIDTPSDLFRLQSELAANNNLSQQIPETSKWLELNQHSFT